MRNAARFKSAKFNTTEARDYFINDNCFGDDLATFLREKLSARGINPVEPWQEDWGWQFETENCLVSVGFNGDEWQIYFEPIPAFFQRLFNEKIDISNLTKTINQILKSAPELTKSSGLKPPNRGGKLISA